MSDYVGFRGITVPYWKDTLKDLMGYGLAINDPFVGQNWDDKIQVVTVWELDTHYNRPRARININYQIWYIVLLSFKSTPCVTHGE